MTLGSRLRDERGVAMVLFAVILPLTFILAAAVWDVGNWWVHRKHLQTKVDAAAFAGGGVWNFPCGDAITGNSATIEATARKFFGPHTTAAGTVLTTGYNPQVGGAAPAQDVHVVLNGMDWYDNDTGLAPADRLSPPNPSICDSKTLDVKATEDDTDALFGWLPFFPDIKRKARVQIEEAEGLSGLLPIAVRIPRPLSAAVVFYDEKPGATYGEILDVKYLCETSSIFGLPAGLGAWTSLSSTDPACSFTSWATFHPRISNGVVIATSFRPRCGAGTPPAVQPCLNVNASQRGTQINDFCGQASGLVQCYFANGSGGTQTINSGLHFIRGYTDEVVGNGPPNVESAWLDTPSPVACAGSYFNAPPVTSGSCSATLHANVDVGSYDPPGPQGETRTTANTDVKYGLVHGNTSVLGSTCLDGQNRPNCDMSPSWTASVPFPSGSARSAVAIRVRLKETTIDNPTGPDTVCGPSYSANCQWFFTAAGRTTNWQNNAAQLLAVFQNPVQRAFRGNIDRSGPIKWLRLTSGNIVSGSCEAAAQDGPAASQIAGAERCFYIDMGLQGGLAKDQDEPPIALNLGDGSSQRALLDCDPNISTMKDEIQKGCGPFYSANTFLTNPYCPSWNGINQFFAVPKAAPFDNWPPYRCVVTQTGTGNQVMQGFNQRLFGVNNNPTCPAENTTLVAGQPEPFTPGRNYWHDANNQLDGYTFAQDNPLPTRGNRLRDDDPRLVTLFFTPYDSFGGSGNEIFPIVAFGNFYITGYGRTTGGGGAWQGGAPEDPCTDGNVPSPLNGLPFGVGNEPPPDLDLGSNEAWVWGHFVDDVKPNASTSGGTGIICNPGASFQPCVAVLVE